MSENELPSLSALLRSSTSRKSTHPAAKLRRSPRKHAAADGQSNRSITLDAVPELYASSRQQRSPLKESIPRKPFNKPTRKTEAMLHFVNMPSISYTAPKLSASSRRRNQISLAISEDVIEEEERNTRPLPSRHSTLSTSHESDLQYESSSNKENVVCRPKTQQTQKISKISEITQAARRQGLEATQSSRTTVSRPKRSNPYVSKEAHCEDLNESSGTEGEDTDTDLSGFIVDDDATLSFDGSAIEISSDESDRESRRRKHQQQKVPQIIPRRRLIRGRQRYSIQSDEEDETAGISNALKDIKLGETVLEKEKNSNRRKTIEVIDVTSSPAPESTRLVNDGSEDSDRTKSQDSFQSEFDPLSLSVANLILQPPSGSQFQLLPTNIGSASIEVAPRSLPTVTRPVTPPTTPPRETKRPQSPTKLKSPSKLFSPSKRALEAPRSPVRQSMDAFWDHNVINEWTDTYSPKKAVLGSPQRKIFLNEFKIHEDDDSISDMNGLNSGGEVFDESSDSLPSPCESPSKNRSASPSKLTAMHVNTIKRRELKAAKQKFDAEKEELASTLLKALDTNITASKISALSASTGGIQIIWSKTLRSTAGRANWKRSVTKASGSPVKGNADDTLSNSVPEVIVQHFASIELADKIIDREERLVDTLAHEFCHLANFMVSNIRDQPHGASFQQWGKKVTSYLRSSAARRSDGYRPSWKKCEVTTKHSYVVEYKYLFVCNGRPKAKRTLAEKFLDLDDEEGCGAEYGRHSKSIDTDKQRCGRCKGMLVQVRPIPRAAPSSPRKQSPRKKQNSQTTDVDDLEKLVASVDLSD